MIIIFSVFISKANENDTLIVLTNQANEEVMFGGRQDIIINVKDYVPTTDSIIYGGDTLIAKMQYTTLNKKGGTIDDYWRSVNDSLGTFDGKKVYEFFYSEEINTLLLKIYRSALLEYNGKNQGQLPELFVYYAKQNDSTGDVNHDWARSSGKYDIPIIIRVNNGSDAISQDLKVGEQKVTLERVMFWLMVLIQILVLILVLIIPERLKTCAQKNFSDLERRLGNLLSTGKIKYPVFLKSVDRPVSQTPEDRPVSPKSVDRPVSQKPEDRPVSPKSVDRPVSQKPEDRPVSPKSVDRPVSQTSEDRPVQFDGLEKLSHEQHGNRVYLNCSGNASFKIAPDGHAKYFEMYGAGQDLRYTLVNDEEARREILKNFSSYASFIEISNNSEVVCPSTLDVIKDGYLSVDKSGYYKVKQKIVVKEI